MLRQVERYGLQLQQQRTEILVYFNNKIEEEKEIFHFSSDFYIHFCYGSSPCNFLSIIMLLYDILYINVNKKSET